MTRLSSLDSSFLRVETPTAHMHVGWLSTLELPAGALEGRPTLGMPISIIIGMLILIGVLGLAMNLYLGAIGAFLSGLGTG